MKTRNKFKGVIYAIIAAATYGMIPLFAKPLYASETNPEGLNPDSVLFFRYLFAIVILAIMIKSRGRSFSVSRKEILPLMAMGAVMAFSSLTLFGSYQYIDGGIASTILFVYPMIVAVIMAIFFRERITLLTVVCCIFVILGISLLYKSDSGATLNTYGVVLVLLSALFYAIYIVAVNRSVLKKIPTVKLTFYMLLFGISLFIIRIAAGSPLIIPAHWYNWGNLLALAVFPTAISFISTTKAVQYIGSTPTAILGALEPVTAVLIGVTVFSEALNMRIVIGLLIIILAVTLVVAAGSINTYLVRFKKLFPRLNKKKNV